MVDDYWTGKELLLFNYACDYQQGERKVPHTYLSEEEINLAVVFNSTPYDLLQFQ